MALNKLGLPNITVIFQGKANTAIARSEKGVACLIIKDNVKEDKRLFTYKNFIEVEKDDFIEENYRIIEDVFMSDVNKLYVIKIHVGEDGQTDIRKAKKVGEDFKTIQHLIKKDVNWITFIAEDLEEQKMLANFVKAENKVRIRKLKAICYKHTLADDMQVVNFMNETVTKSGGLVWPGYKYMGRLLGILAACRLDQSATYKELRDLEEVSEFEDIDDVIAKGGFTLINDDDYVRVGRAINSMQTNDKNHTEDMRYIAIVEGMNLMYEDVVKTFKESYIGKFKNSYDNQVLLISAINSYFRSLAKDEVLDPNFNNHAEVDVETQREKWIADGNTEAEGWNEKEVKNMTYRTNVFLTAKVKFLNAIEDLDFVVNM